VMQAFACMDAELRRIWNSAYALLSHGGAADDDRAFDHWAREALGKPKRALRREVGDVLKDRAGLQEALLEDGKGPRDLVAIRDFRNCFHGGPYFRAYAHGKTREGLQGFSPSSAAANQAKARRRGWRNFLAALPELEPNLVLPKNGRAGLLARFLRLPEDSPLRRVPDALAEDGVARAVRRVALYGCHLQHRDGAELQDSAEAQLSAWTAAFLSRLWLDALVDVRRAVRALWRARPRSAPALDEVDRQEQYERALRPDYVPLGAAYEYGARRRGDPGARGLRSTRAGREALRSQEADQAPRVAFLRGAEEPNEDDVEGYVAGALGRVEATKGVFPPGLAEDEEGRQRRVRRALFLLGRMPTLRVDEAP
jgi:hypothetical protein